MRPLTDAQKRALDWLPTEGTRTDAGKLSSALNSLSLRGFAAASWEDVGPRGGRKLVWRLTPEGKKLKEPGQ